MSKWPGRIIIFLVTIAASFAAFEIMLRLQEPGWSSSEHVAIIFWSTPLGFIVLAVVSLLRRRFGQRSATFRALIVAAAAIAVTIIWTLAAVVLTGGYALAFDANPLWCWLIGSISGLVTGLFCVRERGTSSSGAATT